MNCNTAPKSTDSREISFLNSTVEFASIDQAKTLLSTSDVFTQTMSPFDYAAKTQNADKKLEADYLEHAANQAQAWSKEDIANSFEMIKQVETKINELGLDLKLPSKIILVNSTCEEEGGAQGYTRGDFIVLNGKPNDHLFLHELWHIISRENPDYRDKAYEVIGFLPTQRVEFPDDIKNLRITNPDAPFIEHYIPLTINGEEKKVIFTTIASAPYTTGSFFKYLMIVLYEVEEETGKTKVITSPPYTVEQASDLREKIGDNTNYIIHPEEITAEHFTMLISGKEVKSPKFIEGLKSILSK